MWRIRKFSIINQIDFDKKLLVCAGCSNWLTTPIFHRPGGVSLNYCEVCVNTGARQHMLEEMLAQSKLKYPCGNRKCDHIETIQKLQQHTESCPYRPIKCPFCAERNLHEFNIANHLRNHADSETDGVVEKLTIEDPVASLNMPLTEKLFMLDLRGHNFIVAAKIIYGSLSLLVAKGDVLDDSIPNDDFVVQFKGERQTREMVKGKMCSVKDIFGTSEKKQHSGVSIVKNVEQCQGQDQGQTIKVKLYLCGFELLELSVIDDCPICYNRFTTEMYQCSNGHSVCHQCIQSLTICAICRAPMDKRKFNLKHVSNFLFPCPNAEVGCLSFMKGIDLSSHKCVFSDGNKIKCDECKEAHFKNNMFRHMKEKHRLCNNLVLIHWRGFGDDATGNTKVYVAFQNLVFRFTSSITSVKNSQNLCFNVQLLYEDSKTQVQKYRYEVHILDNHEQFIANYKIGNLCQTQSDSGISSAIESSFCKKFDVQGTVYIRYCVYEL